MLRGQDAHRQPGVAARRRLRQGLDKRIPFDPVKAKALLAEAGYPNGFGVTLDCVNVGYREAVCQAAAAMLTQVGIRVQVRSSPTNTFFPRLSTANASFVEFGWTAAPDPWTTLNGRSHVRSCRAAWAPSMPAATAIPSSIR